MAGGEKPRVRRGWCSSGALHVLLQKKRSGGPCLGCRGFTVTVRSRLITECVRRARIGPDVENLLMFLSQMAQPLDVLGRDPGILVGIMIEHGTEDVFERSLRPYHTPIIRNRSL